MKIKANNVLSIDRDFSSKENVSVRLKDVSKTYRNGQETIIALDTLSLDVPQGAFLSIMGPSGSGKSTLMHCAAGMDVPSTGTIHIGDAELTGLSETRRTQMRRDRIGFVFQSYNLIPALTISDNITLPLRLAKRPINKDWIRMLVKRVGIEDLLQRRPAELSGGQQQRVSLARALSVQPDVVFADEPTGALDLHTAAEVMGLLNELVSEFGQTVIMVTHDPTAASWAEQTIVMADGHIVDHLYKPGAELLAARLSSIGRLP